MSKKPEVPKERNFVAKYARQFNKATVFRDKTKYSRKEKHKKGSQDPFNLIIFHKYFNEGYIL